MQGKNMKNCYNTVFSASTYILIFAWIQAKIWLKFGYWIFSFANVVTLIKTLDAADLVYVKINVSEAFQFVHCMC